MLLSPGMCWFPTPPAILKPRPATQRAQNQNQSVRTVQRTSAGTFGGYFTFGSFHQFDLHHLLGDGFPPADVESDQRARLLQGLHGSAVGHVLDVGVVDPQDDVVDPETQDVPSVNRTAPT